MSNLKQVIDRGEVSGVVKEVVTRQPSGQPAPPQGPGPVTPPKVNGPGPIPPAQKPVTRNVPARDWGYE